MPRTLDGIGLRVNVMRGLSSERAVDREFVTREEAAARLREYLEEDREEIYEVQRLYTTLGILEKETDLFSLLLNLYSEGVLGFYDAESDRFYVVRGAQGFGPAEARTYAHEFVHALQQQHFAFHSTLEALESNSDGARAFTALLEGDAMLVELLYVSEYMAPDEQQASEAEASDALIQAFTSAPHVVQMEYIFPYEMGLEFVAGLYLEDGWDAVDQAFQDPPQSTEQILHPDKYLARETPDQVEVPDLIEALGEGWTQVTQDTFGEFLLWAYLSTDFSSERAFVAATGWGGDTVALLEGPQDESLLVLPIIWDTQEDAREFFDTFVEFTQSRTGALWDWEGDEATAMSMTLPDQSIFVGLEERTVLLIFAPDSSTLDTMRRTFGTAVVGTD